MKLPELEASIQALLEMYKNNQLTIDECKIQINELRKKYLQRNTKN